MNLRPYQSQAIIDICTAWHTHTSVVYQGATGSGKTAIAKQIIDDSGAKTLFVVHRKELLEQNEHIFKDSLNVTVAMVQTLHRRNIDLNYDLIVIDEAHHATSKMYEKLFNTFSARILGLTATPKRLDGKALGDKFQVLVKGPTIQELITDGYLARPEIYVPPKTAKLVDDNRGEWKVTAGDYNHKYINKFFEDNQKVIFGDVLEHYLNLAHDQPTIVFCPSVQAVYDTTRLFNDHKIDSRGIDGSLDLPERKNRLQLFREGQLQCLMSCDLISEGFDMPDAYAAIMLRPTKSLTVYLQQAGRVLRMNDNKHKCIIIDHVNNTAQFGPPWLPRYWSLEGYGERTKRDTLSGINLKLCLKCANYIDSSAVICKHCGYVFKNKAKQWKINLEQLECITIESAQQLITDQCQKLLNKEKWKMLKTLEDFKQHAADKNYSNPEEWAEKAFARKQAEDKVYFEGDRDALIVLFTKRKKDNPAAEADKVLVKRADFKASGKSKQVVQVFETGTLEEIIEYIKTNKPDVNDPEAYARGVMKKRLAPVFASGTPKQVSEAVDITAGVPTESQGPDPNDDKFTQMIKFAKSGKMKDEHDQPKVLSDEEAEKFARNVVRKQVKADLDSKDPVRVREAVVKMHIKNVDAYVKTILEGATV